MQKKMHFLIGAVALPIVLASCSHMDKQSSAAYQAVVSDPYAHASGAGMPMQFAGTDMTDTEIKQLNHLVYYFDFDKSDIHDAQFPFLRAHAKYLRAHPSAHIRIEGHTDERGSREYNVALGERRAKSMARVLMLEGAMKSQITIVSYGEEKPAVQGHDESAWKLNRRGVIVYEKTE